MFTVGIINVNVKHLSTNKKPRHCFCNVLKLYSTAMEPWLYQAVSHTIPDWTGPQVLWSVSPQVNRCVCVCEIHMGRVPRCSFWPTVVSIFTIAQKEGRQQGLHHESPMATLMLMRPKNFLKLWQRIICYRVIKFSLLVSPEILVCMRLGSLHANIICKEHTSRQRGHLKSQMSLKLSDFCRPPSTLFWPSLLRDPKVPENLNKWP